MRITMENCGNIEIGDLQLKPGVPNIKYACPGSGKTVLARALRAFIQDDIAEKEALQPWRTGTEEDGEEVWGPEMFGYESLTSVLCFDQRFMERFDWQRSERSGIEYVLYPKQETIRKDGKGPRRIAKPMPCNIRVLAKEAQDEINKVLELLCYDLRLVVEEGDGEDTPLNNVILIRTGKQGEQKTDGENEAIKGEQKADGESKTTQEGQNTDKEEEQTQKKLSVSEMAELLKDIPKPFVTVKPEPDGSINRALRMIIALMVFRRYALKMEPSLILIDETEPEYSKNVLYVMLSVMFCWKDGFKDRTTLYLTRNRYVVADCLQDLREKFITEPFVTAMTNQNGELTERQILPEHIGIFDEQAEAHIKDEVDSIYRLLYLRRALGYRRKNTLARVMISGLFAGMTVPEYHSRDMTIIRPMGKDEYETAEEEIKEFLPGFIYKKELARIKNRELLTELYFGARSTYEKLLIYQLLVPRNKRDKEIQEYLVNVFSKEEDNPVQVDPLVIDCIPYHITAGCERAVEELGKRKQDVD